MVLAGWEGQGTFNFNRYLGVTQIFNPVPGMTPYLKKEGYRLGHSLNLSQREVATGVTNEPPSCLI